MCVCAPQLFRELVYDGLNVDVLHAERTQAQRDATVAKFRAGKVWVLIATELVARGMDFKGVSLVINYDFPQSTTSYIHRIGRTGRAGRAGKVRATAASSSRSSEARYDLHSHPLMTTIALIMSMLLLMMAPILLW